MIPKILRRNVRALDRGRPSGGVRVGLFDGGDIAAIAKLCDVADAHGAIDYLDEVHAVGYTARAAAASRKRGHQPSLT